MDYNNEIISFENMNLNKDLLRGIYSMGYEKPSSIQSKAILEFRNGKDIIGQSQSGSGKTAAFSIGILEKIETSSNTIQAVILTHTRELAFQIKNVMTVLGKWLKVKICLTIGGTSVKNNIDELNNNPHIVIGTPGRTLDMINKKALNTRYLKNFIIDEADEMLSNIFLNQIYDIFRFLPSTIQVGLFSATMNDDFFRLSKCFIKDPVKILVKNNDLTLEGIRQFYINVIKHEFKFETLCDLYETFSVSQSIIYCNSKKSLCNLKDKLKKNCFSVCYMYGEMKQEDRNKIMDQFRKGNFRIMICTDLLSRGIDIQQVSIVINYDIPLSIENYIHRIGRSGRFGRKGVAINFTTINDSKKISEIESYYSTNIEAFPDNLDLQNIF
jgi:superfamily II DNA/RNA helicase